MRRLFGLGLTTLLGVVGLTALLVVPGLAAPAAQPVSSGAVTMEWLGWSHFRFTSPTGKVILTNPFTSNPDSPVKPEDIEHADLIVAADGHGDEIGSTVQIAQNTGARTFTPFELGTWLTEQGVPQAQVTRSNPGGRLKLGDITVRMVASQHGSALPAPSPTTPYGGPAAGYFITFENGWTVYFSGSTPVESEQAIWAQLYKPDMAILHMGADHDPLDFAYQVKLLKTENPNLKTIVPHHNRVTPPAGQVTVADMQAAMDDMGLGLQVTQPPLAQPVSFSKP
jgi:L-ascorbate metabolism protein UlaG (beta-lactamase superfamily)